MSEPATLRGALRDAIPYLDAAAARSEGLSDEALMPKQIADIFRVWISDDPLAGARDFWTGVVSEKELRVGNVVVAATDAATRATDYLAHGDLGGLPRSDLTRAYLAGTMLASAARRAAADLPSGEEGS